MSKKILVGVDIGHKRDPKAICVVELDERRDERNRIVNHFVVRHLERQPIGSSYPSVARRLSEVIAGIRQRVDLRPRVYGAFRVGTHDDLVTALGLAVHEEPRWARVY